MLKSMEFPDSPWKVAANCVKDLANLDTLSSVLILLN